MKESTQAKEEEEKEAQQSSLRPELCPSSASKTSKRVSGNSREKTRENKNTRDSERKKWEKEEEEEKNNQTRKRRKRKKVEDEESTSRIWNFQKKISKCSPTSCFSSRPTNTVSTPRTLS